MRSLIAGLGILVLISCTQPPAAGRPGPSASDCAAGLREPADAAGRFVPAPHSSPIECLVSVHRPSDTTQTRVYRLKNGREITLYEYLGELPTKPASIREGGTSGVNGRVWTWGITDHADPVAYVETQMAGHYINLSLLLREQFEDMDLLRGLAAGLDIPTAAEDPHDPDRASCETHGRPLAAPYSNALTLVGAMPSTAGATAHWEYTRFGPDGPRPVVSRWSALPQDEKVVFCYFDGDFSRFMPPGGGGTRPVYERALVLVPVNAPPWLDHIGSKSNTPLVVPPWPPRPEPSAGAATPLPLTELEKRVIDALAGLGVTGHRAEHPYRNAAISAELGDEAILFVNAHPIGTTNPEITVIDERQVEGITVRRFTYGGDSPIRERFECSDVQFDVNGSVPPAYADMAAFVAAFIRALNCSA
jgi:hypothetical protein